jgi:glucokinase
MIDVGVASDAAPCLALDIGATKIEGALVEPDGTVVCRERLVLREIGDDLMTPICSMLRRFAASTDVSVLGVACAGPMIHHGESVSPLNIPTWRDYPLRDQLMERMDLAVHVDGDARALALAESFYGAARDVNSFPSMVVSSGIGGGFVMDGRLIDGASGNAGHVGHLTVVPDGRACSCGSFGCLEAEASGMAIENMTGRPPIEADQAVRERTSRLVGLAVGTLGTVLDFNHCFVAGSVALGFAPAFFGVANEAAREVATLAYAANVRIWPSGLGADGPLLGAAMVAWRGVSS